MVCSRKGRQLELGQRQLGFVQGVERVAEMDEHEVALVAQERGEAATAVGGVLHGPSARVPSFVHDLLARHRGNAFHSGHLRIN